MNITVIFAQVSRLPRTYILIPMQSTVAPAEDTRQLWENVLVDIELSVSKANFSTWFKDTHIVKIEEGIVYLGVPNQFVKDWLVSKFHKLIVKSLRGLSENVRGLEYLISKGSAKKHEIHEERRAPAALGELQLGEYYINKENNLNPRYTFDTFIIGGFNELAFAAAQAVIKKPGISYNPLFIYGDTGLGKTHLIQAIGNHIKAASPERRVYYMTSEKFALDYFNSLQTGRINSFKEKYRQYDVLIMDDIQFFSKKEKSQEELFHLFNTLYDNNKQIVFSSDQHPNYIANLEERLKSRFSAGMIVDISSPDHESRIAILKAKTKANTFGLSDEVVDFIATSVEGNIRELEGALNTIMCHAQLRDKTLTVADVKNLIKNAGKPKKTVSIKEVIKAVADFYQIDEASIYEKTRRKEVVKPRQLIMYLLREDFNISYPTIGQKLGGRDHTTVIHSCEKIKNDLKQDPNLHQEIQQMRALLK